MSYRKIIRFLFIIFLWVCFPSRGQVIVQGAHQPGENAGTLGEVASNLTTVTGLFEGLFNNIFYIIGIVFVITSIMRYRGYRINPSQTPISRPILFLLFGIIMVFLPAFIHFLSSRLASR